MLRNKPYWFANGIYPKAPFFTSSISEPFRGKQKLFGFVQDANGKDIERGFGVIQGKFNIISRPSKFLAVDTMEENMRCIIILYNMLVEERNAFNLCLDEGEEDGSNHIDVGEG